MQGVRAGYVHTKVEELAQDGAKVYRGVISLRLHVKRFNEIIQLSMDNGTYELADGAVFGTFMKQMVGANKSLEITGAVDGRELRLTLDKTKTLKPAPWDPHVVGVCKQRTLYQDRNLKPGDSFTYKTFQPTLNVVVTAHVEAKESEEVELFAGKQKRRLLRIEEQAEKIDNFQLAPVIAWVDELLMPVRMQLDVPGLGKILLYQTTKDLALSPGSAAPQFDVGTSHYVKLSRRILRPYETTAAVYRIRVKDEPDVASTFAQDGRQQVRNVQGESFELSVRSEGNEENAEKPGAEFIQSSYFINSDDAKVKELAHKAIGSAEDPWQKSLNIEKWVHNHMRVSSGEGLAPADQVARTLTGDCTEFAMLTAAMCRAEGIPSRTAMGLIYADSRSGPVFAFHMWTEVWIAGRWLPLDATLGLGHIGATHLKISAQSWHDERSMTPLLPVVRVLDRLAIEVVRVEGR